MNEVAKKDTKLDLSLSDSDMTMIMMVTMMVVMVMYFLSPLLRTLQAQAASQSYHGTEDPRALNATNNLNWINLIYNYPYTPWISAYLINDGPGSVEIGINYPEDMFTMNAGETITITRSGAEERISAIYYISRTGTGTTLRVTGVY